MGLLLVVAPLLGLTPLGATARSPVAPRAAAVRAMADFDPFSTPRGPPLEQPAAASELPPATQIAPPGDEDADLVLGARVLGGALGGLLGNSLSSGFERAGLASCTPFNLAGCDAGAAPSARSAAPAPASTGGTDAIDGWLAELLRNPTSILPQEWKLDGRKYFDDLSSDAASLVGVPPVSAAGTPEGVLSVYDAHASLATLQQAAPPAPDALLPSGGIDGSGFLLDGSGVVLDQLSVAIAEGSSGGAGGVIATLLFTGVGAIACEYVATNKEPPVPDPLFGALYSTLHAPVRVGSKATGVVANKLAGLLKGVLPF